jgi:glycosyltransferase involved in cell wall biosynthesis
MLPGAVSLMRLAALYSHPVQYNAPLFRELSKRPGVELTVYFLSRHGVDVTYDPLFGQSFKWDTPLLDGYDHKFLPNVRRGGGVSGFFKLINISVIKEIRNQRYDALMVHGYEHFAKWLAFAAAKSCGTRLILRGESHLNEPRTAIRRAVKRVILGNLFKCFDSVTYLGTLNRRYFEFYGVSPERLHFAPYSVDNAFFRDSAMRLGPRRCEFRKALGIDDSAPVILSIGKLIDVKQPELLLQAFSSVRKQQACHLVYVGDGALRQRVEAQAARLAIPDVHVTGFINQTRIPEMHVAGDILVLPSRHEPWGLAVNEGMAAGLPVVVTDRVGCAGDLVRDGVNGFVVPYQNVELLARRLQTLVSDGRLRAEYGNRSREIVEGWSIEKTADGIIAAATAARLSDKLVEAPSFASS